ncbi:hypothetical protein KAJ27_16530 [bacterium]|nr:hypothetical protein [bacterium]
MRRFKSCCCKFNDPERILLEEKIVKTYFGGLFIFDVSLFSCSFSGEYTTSYNDKFVLNLSIPIDYPLVEPVLVVANPVYLKRSIYSFAFLNGPPSHEFHTHGVDHLDRVKICYCKQWDASQTCAKALLAGCFWLEVYSEYLRDKTKTIHKIIENLIQSSNSNKLKKLLNL